MLIINFKIQDEKNASNMPSTIFFICIETYKRNIYVNSGFIGYLWFLFNLLISNFFLEWTHYLFKLQTAFFKAYLFQILFQATVVK